MLPAQSAWVATRASPGDERERIGFDWAWLPMRGWQPSERLDWSIWFPTQDSVGYSSGPKLQGAVTISNLSCCFSRHWCNMSLSLSQRLRLSFPGLDVSYVRFLGNKNNDEKTIVDCCLRFFAAVASRLSLSNVRLVFDAWGAEF
jgi:hypothetical protein